MIAHTEPSSHINTGRGRRKVTTGARRAGLIAVTGVLVFPIYWMVNVALQPDSELYSYPPHYIPDRPTLEIISRVMTERALPTWILNSLVITAASVLATLVVAIPAGYALSRFSSRTLRLMGTGLLVTRMLPPTLLIIPMFVAASQVSLLDTRLALIITNLSFIAPFATWMLKSYFDSIPYELEEAAMVDGAPRWRVVLQVVAPLAAPGIAATALYGAILSWDEFVFARTLLSSDDLWTVSVGLSSFKGEYLTKTNEMMAASLIGALPVLLVFLLVERHLVRGLTAGGVRG